MQNISMSRRQWAYIQIAAMLFAIVSPMLLTVQAVRAEQITERFIMLSNVAADGTTADLTFQFDTPASPVSDVERIELEFCTSPISTCVAPTGLVLPATGVPTVSQANWAGATAFGTYTLTNGDNGGTNNQAEVSRTDATTEESGVDLQIGFDGVTLPTDDEWYVRIRLFDASTGGTESYQGNVAKGIGQIDITTYVRETLDFCVGATVATAVGDCTDLTGTSINLGTAPDYVLSSSTTETGNSYFRASTNAYNGLSIQYVSSTIKSGTTGIDPVTAETDLSAGTGTEQFGLAVDTTETEHDFTNLVADTGYDNASTDLYNFCTVTGYAGDNTLPCDNATEIASAPAGDVIDYETGSMEYASNIAAITPAGTYTTTVTYIACPTF